MKLVRIVNKVFSIAEASDFIKEERPYSVRMYKVLDYSPYAIIGRDTHTHKIEAFRPQQRRKLWWVQSNEKEN